MTDTPERASCAVLVREGDYVELTDLDTAGYLFAKKVHVEDAWKVSRFKYKIRFYDPTKRAERLAIDFVNSDCADYADAICRLKKIIHKFYGRDEERKNSRNGAFVPNSNE